MMSRLSNLWNRIWGIPIPKTESEERKEYIKYTMLCTHENRHGTMDQLEAFFDTLQSPDKTLIRDDGWNPHTQLKQITETEKDRVGIVSLLFATKDPTRLLETIRVHINEA
jgi:hypothetical protein